MIWQEDSRGEEEWCAEQELEGQEKEKEAQIATGIKIKRLRKKTPKTKQCNRGKHNAEKKRVILNCARKIS